MDKLYVCVCGKSFTTANSFNGHKSHCKQHQISKHGSLDFYNQVKSHKNEKISITATHNAEIKRGNEIEKWIQEQHCCETCGKVMTEKYGSGRFCCKACANTRSLTIQTKQLIADSVSISSRNTAKRRRLTLIDLYNQNPARCIICDCVLEYNNRKRKVCDKPECIHECRSRNGRKSVYQQGDSRRSKSEMYFCELCEKHFENVEHNVPIFDGWDADVIIHDVKVAVLWNGIWHYQKIKNNQSLEQIRQRDQIKISKIIEFGYIPYVIQQDGTFDKSFIEEKFNEFLSVIDSQLAGSRFESEVAHQN